MLGNATQPLIPMRPWEVHFKYPFRFFSYKKHFRFSKNDCFISLFIFHFYFAGSLMNDGKVFQFFFICRFMVFMTKVLSRTPLCKRVNYYRCTGTFPTYCLNSNRLKDKHFTGQRHVTLSMPKPYVSHSRRGCVRQLFKNYRYLIWRPKAYRNWILKKYHGNM